MFGIQLFLLYDFKLTALFYLLDINGLLKQHSQGSESLKVMEQTLKMSRGNAHFLNHNAIQW